jgi:signal transduction histidine kinase
MRPTPFLPPNDQMNIRVALSFLIKPPGSLVYHITMAVIFGLLAALALTRRSGRMGGLINPWSLAATTLLSVRIVLLLVEILSWLNLLQGPDLPLSLGRFSSIIGIALIGWASIFPRPTRFADLALTIVIALGVLGLVASIFDLVSTPIISAPVPAMVWGAFGLVLSLVACIALALVQPDFWSLSLVPFLLLMIGFVLNLSFAGEAPAAEGFVRLTELPAYALFAFLGSRFLILPSAEGLSPESTRLSAAEERIRFLEQEIARLEFPFKEGSEELAEEPGAEAGEVPQPGIREAEARRPRKGTGPLLESRAAITPEHQLRSELQIVLGELAEAREELKAYKADSGSPAATRPGFSVDGEALELTVDELYRRANTSQSHVDLLLSDAIGLTGALQRKFLERLKDNLRRTRALLDQLSDLVAIEAGDMAHQAADLMDCIDQALRDAADIMHSRDVVIQLDMPDEIPPVTGEPETIRQIMLDLLQHAIQASPEESVIELHADRKETEEGEFLVFSVSDRSGGVPAEQIGSLFQASALAGDAEGSDGDEPGPGLPTVKTLCEALGWRVWAESETGIGSTFTILMPLYSPPRAGSADTTQEGGSHPG